MDDTNRELRLAAALVEAADTLTEGFDRGRQLRRLADRCVEVLSARGAGIMLIEEGRAASLTASGAREELALELLAAQREEGPCLDSYRSRRPVPPVALGSAGAASRWPGFTRRALRHGVAATFAVPLRRRERVLGALNVFLPDTAGTDTAGTDGRGADIGRVDIGRVDIGGTDVGVTDIAGTVELRLAQALADGAVLGLHNNALYRQCRARAGQLEQALSSRVRIEQAKGMLAERWGTAPDDAFTALRRYARRHRLPLERVAQSVVEGTADDAALRRESGQTDP
ncbi:GAF and ANTAR domain-containing protein [Streptomyces broussonetiae]|uniref:GAF and ANTAR domain-containing protein n=1 Tax=Streptomyces broussonetiae TaxID=2686304 RepID=A0ABV5E8E8_9ACTN